MKLNEKATTEYDPEKYNIVSIYNVTFYVQDEDGNEILNTDGTIKEFHFEERTKPFDHSCDGLTLNDLSPVEETKND